MLVRRGVRYVGVRCEDLCCAFAYCAAAWALDPCRRCRPAHKPILLATLDCIGPASCVAVSFRLVVANLIMVTYGTVGHTVCKRSAQGKLGFYRHCLHFPHAFAAWNMEGRQSPLRHSPFPCTPRLRSGVPSFYRTALSGGGAAAKVAAAHGLPAGHGSLSINYKRKA